MVAYHDLRSYVHVFLPSGLGTAEAARALDHQIGDGLHATAKVSASLVGGSEEHLPRCRVLDDMVASRCVRFGHSRHLLPSVGGTVLRQALLSGLVELDIRV